MRDVQTIQQTAKHLKLQAALSMSLFIVFVFFALLIYGTGRIPFVTGSISVASLAWYIVTRVRTWWHHG